MTEITKATVRRTTGEYRVLHHRKARKIVAAFLPGDVIEFRESGRRLRFSITIDDAFRLALRFAVEAKRRAKREGRAA